MKEGTSLGMGWEEFISCSGGGKVAQEFADSGASFAEGSGKIARGEELGKGGKVQGGQSGDGCWEGQGRESSTTSQVWS